ncbi:MAG TPA: hypothetical protein VMH30_11275, partial [Verrucomicrobiae bacterium]|nr:hypothetical protein [Verrucomicrobiae bacterium]
MQRIRYVYWQDGDAWLGYLEEYPDYLTQGESLADLEEHLRDLLKDLSSGVIPSVRKVADCKSREARRTHPGTYPDGLRIHPTWRKARL